MDAPKFSVFCAVSKEKCSGLSFPTPQKCCDWCSVPRHVGGIPHANLLLEEEGTNDMLFQKDGALAHYFHIAVQAKFLDQKLLQKWIDQQRQPCHLFASFPRPCMILFFFWSCIKGAVYIPPLLATLQEHAGKIQTATVTVLQPYLQLYGLNLNTCMPYLRGLFMVSLLSI
jgi:hypothetical protein